MSGTEPGPLSFESNSSITASWPFASTNFWHNSWSIPSLKEVSFNMISAICLHISSLWIFFGQLNEARLIHLVQL